jgi:hypothetical protein
MWNLRGDLVQNEPNRRAGRPEIELRAAGRRRKRHCMRLANAELAVNIGPFGGARRLRQSAANEVVKAKLEARDAAVA